MCAARGAVRSHSAKKVTGRAFDRQIGSTKRGDRYTDCRIRTGFAFDRPICYATGDRKWSSGESRLSQRFECNLTVAKILVIGAGAVGRGFVAPLLAKADVTLDFVDKEKTLVDKFSGRTEYVTAFTGPDGYELVPVTFGNATLQEGVCDIGRYDTVFICVGPRNYLSCAQLVRNARAVFVMENDRDASDRLGEAVGSERVRFGIPDAIVSNTATAALLRRDPLCLIAERGELILEAGAENPDLDDAVVWANTAELEKHWICKFFIHNTSHAIVAFLGTLGGHAFVHEAMSDARIGPVVERAMQVITEAIIAESLVEEKLARTYMARELERFRNPLMFDPISRVARDPLRKLDRGDRLIRALNLVVGAGLNAYPIMLGVNAALVHLETANDEARSLRSDQSRSHQKVLREVCGLSDENLIREILSVSASELLQPAKAHSRD